MIGELQDKNKSPSLSIAFKIGYIIDLTSKERSLQLQEAIKIR